MQLLTQVGEKLEFAKSGFAVSKPGDTWRLKIKVDMAIVHTPDRYKILVQQISLCKTGGQQSSHTVSAWKT